MAGPAIEITDPVIFSRYPDITCVILAEITHGLSGNGTIAGGRIIMPYTIIILVIIKIIDPAEICSEPHAPFFILIYIINILIAETHEIFGIVHSPAGSGICTEHIKSVI